MPARTLPSIFNSLLNCCFFIFFICHSAFADTPRVLASIKPLHSLVSNITDGISTPGLLLSQEQSAHHFQLRPSQKRQLNQADVFFYSNDNIESFVPALKNTRDKLRFIQLSDSPDIKMLPARSTDKHSHAGNSIDGHAWLSINNAILFSRYAADTLSKLDPRNAAHYQSNLSALLIKLETLGKANAGLLSDLKNKPFLMYHDAYQYFEIENGLNQSHFVTSSPEHTPGIKRVKELRALIRIENIQCIFYEPPNIPPLLKTLAEGMPLKFAPLDPAGSQIPAGKQHYFKLMQQTALTLHNCLSLEK